MDFMFLLLLFVVNSEGVTSSDKQSDNETWPYENQIAQCTVTAGDVQARAEASVSKSLHGVCGSDEMKIAFTKLELKLTQELEVIKQMLIDFQALRAPAADKLLFSDARHLPLRALHTYPSKSKADTNVRLVSDKPNENLISTQSKFIQGVLENNTSPDTEVNKLNNSILSGSETKIFTYYWKLGEFSRKINSNVSIIYSPMFIILGKHLRLKAVVNHLKRDFLYLQLNSATNESHKVVAGALLETRNLLKPLQTFQYKYKIAVLQQYTSSNKDLESQELTNIGNGFLIPNSALLENYLKNDTLIIKLVVYLGRSI